MNKYLNNFETIAAELISSGSTEKAKAFATKICDQVRVMGGDWLISNAGKLSLSLSAQEQKDIAPVCDNRIWYITRFQDVLRGAV